MPAALDVDREQVRMLVQQMGVREAARRMGLNQETVSAWSARYKWLADMPRSMPLPASMVKHASIASTAPEASVNYLKDILVNTRTNHAKIAQIASQEMLTVAETSPAMLQAPEVAGVLLTHAKHAALAGGWQDHAPTPRVNLGAVSTAQAPAMEAEIISSDVAQMTDDELLAGF